ncbi:ABC transporter substrate-binding protein [Polymorphospora rubra]|uniref:Diguanylate phosphodiesterase n=1 Tax=Polymorphospora rubra TaxID=338584 RepID=A0A810N5J4_9ACTN|nr:ABC transporter substrate-binding protein [Polymorphospora rubra]BCJ68220.1 diguanylate phosphodiesterase [Polymorphospora rubra]
MRSLTARLGALALAGVLGLTACSFESDSSTGDSTGATTLRVANPTPVVSLNPFAANSADQPTLTVVQEVFETLVVRENGEIAPKLAESWTNPDPLTWQFVLRKDVTFADGTPMTSADAKASLQALIDGKGPLAGLWATVDEIGTPDEHTLTIHTSSALGTVLSNLTLLWIAPAAKLADSAFFNAPYGTGPFKVSSFTAGQSVELARNDNYRGEQPKLETISYRYIPEVSGRVTALSNNEIDVTWGLPPDQLTGLRGNDALTVESFPTYANYYIWFNSSREPFTDARVRQAMWHAVDFGKISSSLFDQAGTPATGPLPDAIFGAAGQNPYAYDPARAKQLLTEAGYPNGFSTSMMWSAGCCTNGNSFADAMISDWAKVGIVVKPEELERATWLDKLLKLDWDSTMTTGSTITGDADFTLARLYLSTANRNGYANPELDRILLAARAEIDQDKRADLYAQAGKIVWDDAVGIFPLDLSGNVVLRKGVEGFTPTPNDLPDFAGVSVR